MGKLLLIITALRHQVLCICRIHQQIVVVVGGGAVANELLSILSNKYIKFEARAKSNGTPVQ